MHFTRTIVGSNFNDRVLTTLFFSQAIAVFFLFYNPDSLAAFPPLNDDQASPTPLSTKKEVEPQRQVTLI